jgi:hypothetical protein
VGLAFEEALALQTQERLADGHLRQAETLGEICQGQPLAGRVGAVDDLLAKVLVSEVRLGAEAVRGAWRRRGMGSGHLENLTLLQAAPAASADGFEARAITPAGARAPASRRGPLRG